MQTLTSRAEPEQDATTEGVDVSAAQSRCDWGKVYAAGIRFAYVRANAGEKLRDASFAPQIAGANAAGVLTGAYHFALADDDPSDDVDAFAKAIGGAQFALPPAVDVEIMNGLTASRVADWLDGWIARCVDQLGRKPVLYTGPNFWTSLGPHGLHPRFADCGLWISNYGATRPTIPAPWVKQRIWQYQANTIWRLADGSQTWGPKRPSPDAKIIAQPGIVAGIEGECDRDVFAGTLAQLRAWAGAPSLDAGHERAGM